MRTLFIDRPGDALPRPVPKEHRCAEIHPGFWHSGGGIEETIHEWNRDDVRSFVLDVGGESFDSELHVGESTGFILSDDQPFTDGENEIMQHLEKVSLGDQWVQGHSCISILHHQLD